jgi:hypothetical protein
MRRRLTDFCIFGFSPIVQSDTLSVHDQQNRLRYLVSQKSNVESKTLGITRGECGICKMPSIIRANVFLTGLRIQRDFRKLVSK